MTKIKNLLKLFGSLSFFTKYSSIVYENNSINVFGIVEYL